MNTASDAPTEDLPTPGPWRSMPRNEYEAYVVGPKHTCTTEQNEDETSSCYCEFIAEVSGFSGREGLANAQLIAAAPDLLAALKALLAKYQALSDCGDCGRLEIELSPQGKAAYAAIAKAEGKP